MKKIKLKVITAGWVSNETISEERAKTIIADLQAQLDAPEPVEFWEGRLVEGYVHGKWHGPFLYVGGMNGCSHRVVDSKGNSLQLLEKDCRPLQDPLILQFKSHQPGDPMPCDGGLRVRILNEENYVMNGAANGFDWSEREDWLLKIIGWMPAAGWGRSE